MHSFPLQMMIVMGIVGLIVIVMMYYKFFAEQAPEFSPKIDKERPGKLYFIPSATPPTSKIKSKIANNTYYPSFFKLTHITIQFQKKPTTLTNTEARLSYHHIKTNIFYQKHRKNASFIENPAPQMHSQFKKFIRICENFFQVV